MSEKRAKTKKCYNPNFVAVKGDRSKFIHGDYRLSIRWQINKLKRDHPGYEIYEVPCGQCAICKQNRLSQWNRVLLAESLTSSVSSFYTLTFDDEHLPPDLYSAKKIFQNFVKRLRNQGLKFKYFCVSERGDLHGRLHFHCLFFGLAQNDSNVADEWFYGFIHSDSCNVKTIHYCVDYMLVSQQLLLFSKGLGYDYFDSLGDRFYDVYGKSIIIPRRYYRLTHWSPEKLQAFTDSMSDNFYSDEQLKTINTNTFVKLKRKGQI